MSVTQGRHGQGKCAASRLDFDAIQQQLRHSVRDRGGKQTFDSQLDLLEFVCVDQETIIVYDPRKLKETGRGTAADRPSLPALAPYSKSYPDGTTFSHREL